MTNWRPDDNTPASSEHAFDYERWFREHPPRRDDLFRFFERVVGRKASGDTRADDGQTEAAESLDNTTAA